jgi:hypothetical protein
MRSFLSNASANSYFTPKHGFGDPVIEVGRAAAVPGSTEDLELPLAIPFEPIVRSAYCDILLGKVKQWYAECGTQKLQKLDESPKQPMT